MKQWAYEFDGAVIARVSRADVPAIGLPIRMAGRLGVPAPVEHFVVACAHPERAAAVLVRDE